MRKYLWLVLFLSGALAGCASRSEKEQQTPIRIAYDRVIVSGQIGLVLEKTDILNKHNLPDCLLTAVSETPDAGTMGDYDVIITGEAGPLTLYSQGMDIEIVACLGYGGRVGLAVRTDSPIQSLNDLKGKNVCYLIRPATGRLLNDWLSTEGLTNKDIQKIPLNTPGMMGRFLSGAGGIDAAVLWDPMMEVLARNKQIRILKEGFYWQGIAMKKKFISEHKKQAVSFMAAFKDAFWFWLSNREEVNQWYADKENLPADIIDQTSQANLNYRNARSINDIILNPDQPEYIQALKLDAQYQYASGFTARLINPEEIINPGIAGKADSRSRAK